MKVVIVIPTYNEKENISVLLDGLRKALSPLRQYTVSYLVVDDTSPDGTADSVKQYAKSHPGVYLLSGAKEGLGKALLRGMEHATRKMDADVIVQMDGDLSHDPAVVPKMLAAIGKGHDFVVGSRYIPGGSIPDNWGLHRKIFSVAGNAIVRFGLGILRVHDWTGGFRAYRRKYYELSKEKVRKYGGYVFQIAFLHRAVQNGADIAEVPIHFTDRKYGHSKIAPSEYIRNVFAYIFAYRWHTIRYGQFGRFLVVGTIGFIINTTLLELFVSLGWHPGFASALGAEFAIISNFFLNNFWTFRGRSVKGFGIIPKLLQFNMTSVGAIIIQSSTVFAGTELISPDLYRLWYVIGVGFGLIWNYTMYSRVIWRRRS